MVAARARFLSAGHYSLLSDALVEVASACPVPNNLLMEVGSGTAYYLARILDTNPGSLGIAVDLSKYAARRAAKANIRIGSIVGDIWDRLPVADGAVGLTLNVFAPRQAKELHRTLHREGILAVVTPQQNHLAELREMLGLLNIDPAKQARLDLAFEPFFRLAARIPLQWNLRLTKADVEALAGMGPSARHIPRMVMAERLAALSEPLTVTASLTIQIYRVVRMRN